MTSINRYFILAIMLLSVVQLSAQTEDALAHDDAYFESNPQSALLGLVAVGSSLTPEYGSFNLTLGVQWMNENFRGLGIEYTNGSIKAQNLNRMPDPSEITNFDSSDNEYPTSFIIDGPSRDYYQYLTMQYTYGLRLGTKTHLWIQAGPSIAFIEQQHYRYEYSGSVGGFGGFSFGNGGPDIIATASGETKTYLGGQLRLNGIVKVTRRTFLSLSPFININSAETISGIQLGLIIGKGYKLRLFD